MSAPTSPLPPVLFLARHGQTSANLPGAERLRGLGDYDLTPFGRKQAAALAHALRALGVVRVATDDIRRTRITADYVGRTLGTEPLHDMGLRPWDIGTFEGMSELVAKPSLLWYVRNPHTAPPAGEPYNDFFNMWRDAFWHYLGRVRETNQRWALIVHSGHFATLDDVLLDRGSTPIADYEPAPGEIFAVDALAPVRVQRI